MLPLVQRGTIHLDVVAPVPYFPRLPWPTRWSSFSHIPAEENYAGVSIYHPRYVVVPNIGMQTHGLSMYMATRSLVQRLHHRHHYQLLDAHWIYPDGYAAVKIAQDLGVPVILSARGNDINEYLDFPKIRPLISWALEQSDHVISVCQALKDLMLPLGIPDKKVSVVSNGVDTTKFFPIAQHQARSQLGLAPDGQLLVSVGILEPRKGHHLLIEALQLLKKQYNMQPSLAIIGAGPAQAQLQTLIQSHALQDQVQLVGEVPNQGLPLWYNAANALCLASDREGWPNVLLESIACGTPVIASRVFGTPEVVPSEEIGLLVTPRTPDAFATAIHCALKKSWSQETLVTFASQHTWQQTASQVQTVFEQVIGNSQARRVEHIGQETPA